MFFDDGCRLFEVLSVRRFGFELSSRYRLHASMQFGSLLYGWLVGYGFYAWLSRCEQLIFAVFFVEHLLSVVFILVSNAAVLVGSTCWQVVCPLVW